MHFNIHTVLVLFCIMQLPKASRCIHIYRFTNQYTAYIYTASQSIALHTYIPLHKTAHCIHMYSFTKHDTAGGETELHSGDGFLLCYQDAELGSQ